MIEELKPIMMDDVQHWERITYLVGENRLKLNELIEHINDLEKFLKEKLNNFQN